MAFNKEQARLALEGHVLVVYDFAGKKYIGYLTKEREGGEFYFMGMIEGGTEKMNCWNKAYKSQRYNG